MRSVSRTNLGTEYYVRMQVFINSNPVCRSVTIKISVQDAACSRCGIDRFVVNRN